MPTAVIVFFYYYQPATCRDGKQNQEEDGVDCGGPCSLICDAQSATPIVSWVRFFKIQDGFYNVASFVENPNAKSSCGCGTSVAVG